MVETLEPEVDEVETPETEVAEAPEESLPEFVREHYDAIRLKEQHVRTLEHEYNAAKSAAKYAKEQFEDADAALRDLIARGPDRQVKLPFPPEQEPEAWRAASIDALEISDTIREKFREAGVETIGQLEDMRAQICDGKANWPRGIGAAKITMIEDAILNWLEGFVAAGIRGE